MYTTRIYGPLIHRTAVASDTWTLRLGRELVVCSIAKFIGTWRKPPAGAKGKCGGILGSLKIGPLVVHYENTSRSGGWQVSHHRDRYQGPMHSCGWTGAGTWRSSWYLPGERSAL